ncbi:MAG: GNAT family N-acetyltransferase [Marinobacter sp.]|uniref:GNAT family N-acetyltransferase n=1 Tax=Marinobacter sp. TaxID=50741 RepID=UPI00299EAA9B|nr:GNAT family N-acetyltransferase [Marinobacter sp.]MDX1756025.1 GNAT family N-acetyltransferase [Marinobacter sp.]
MAIRNARKEDARDLAFLINLAGEGLPAYLWQSQAGPGESGMEVGVKRAAREEGGFSYRNARVFEHDGKLAGMAVAYPLADPYDVGALTDLPEVVKPLIELEARAPGSWYLNALATFEPYRRQGVARQLMADSALLARSRRCRSMSLIVASDNVAAAALYERLGFQERARKPAIPYPGCARDGDWVLMVKALGVAPKR